MSTRLRLYIFVALVCALSLIAYILGSSYQYRRGFPLDDAWIHQSYARNLGLNGEWAFLSGQPSAGSTAPLYSGMLSLGYVLGLSPYIWTFLLGWISLFSLAIVGALGFKVLCPDRAQFGPWVAIFLALEWHLVWAAGSGMETLVYAAVALTVIVYIARGSINWLVLGMLIGMSIWLRPDGLTLMGPAIVVLFTEHDDRRSRILGGGKLIVGVIVMALPYLIFNRLLAGAWWPNTFFAKQAEYNELRSLPIWWRAFDQFVLPLVGSGAILLPGFFIMVVDSLRRRAWGEIVGAIWFFGYLLIYAWRLPVTYQHGRYVMPAMPVYFVWSLAGMARWLQPGASSLWRRTISRVWIISLGFVLVIFWGLGLRTYALDVAIIESEMVDTAIWVSENTEQDDLIAAHDIGALGYYAQRPLLDLAGLVSPEVIPILRDEKSLEAVLDDQKADYLVTFPGWYPYLVSRSVEVYSTQAEFSPKLGGENMSVYRWLVP